MTGERRGFRAAVDVAGIVIAGLLAFIAARGPEPSSPVRFEEGAILSAQLLERGDLGQERELRFALDGGGPPLFYGWSMAKAAMVRTSLQRGREAVVGISGRGRIVTVEVDGQAILTAEDSAAAMREAWVGALLCLMILMAGFVLLRPGSFELAEAESRVR